MSKSFSGLFHGTLGTTLKNGSSSPSYSDRGISVPDNIKKNLSRLKKPGDIISGSKDSFPMKDVSIMSKESGVEFAHVTIGNKAYLIRGDKNGAKLTPRILAKIKKHGGSMDYHTHPYDNDCVPSKADTDMLTLLKGITGQTTSHIVTPNGRTILFGETGAVSAGTVSNVIDESLKKAFLELWR
ncbi:MAG: hypothetical protein J5767_12070 [Paludibacteraceae bacterium]|nr:hypothetical protein [Paludibacteraceae bacterium]